MLLVAREGQSKRTATEHKEQREALKQKPLRVPQTPEETKKAAEEGGGQARPQTLAQNSYRENTW
eukprot:1671394-Amphidinium_carterae.1